MSQREHPPVLAESLGKKYSRGWALRDCSLEIPAGRIVALVGPNGAGKSTLMGMITGLLRPTTGRISVLTRPAYPVLRFRKN